MVTIAGKRKAVLASEKIFTFSWKNQCESANRLFMSDGCSWFEVHDASIICRVSARDG